MKYKTTVYMCDLVYVSGPGKTEALGLAGPTVKQANPSPKVPKVISTNLI